MITEILKKRTKMNKLMDLALVASAAMFVVTVLSAGQPLCGDIKVYPRLITPGASQDNNNVFFDFDDYDEPKPELKLFSVSGRLVRSIQVVNPAATTIGWRQVWDGRDENGSIVSPGVYIYQWLEGNTSTTGSIVVAR